MIIGHARADVIFSTFGPGNSYDSTSGQAIYDLDVGLGNLNRGVSVSFVPSTTEKLGQVMVAVNAPDIPFTVTVAENIDFSSVGGGDAAGAALETFDVTGDSSPEILTLQSVLNPVLTAGQKYWVEMQAGPSWIYPDMGTWFNNDQGIIGEISTYDTTCRPFCVPYTRDAVAPAVEVSSLEPTSVPEPDRIAPLLGAALAIGFVTLKKFRAVEAKERKLINS